MAYYTFVLSFLLPVLLGVFAREAIVYLKPMVGHYRGSAITPCFDAYKDASTASVHQIEQLWTGDGPFLGLAHVTVAGAKHHGLKHTEVWLQTLAAKQKTPIHKHDCEELNIVTKGTGVLNQLVNGKLSTTPLKANSTVIAPAGVIYQVENTGRGELQTMVVIACPNPSIYVYDTWNVTGPQSYLYPMAWNAQCPPILEEAMVRRTMA